MRSTNVFWSSFPFEWTEETIKVGDQEWSAKDHGLSLIFPNPLNRSKYIVLNSGHTFHDKDFRSSNAWLFPRLGDIAVQRLRHRRTAAFRKRRSGRMFSRTLAVAVKSFQQNS